MSNPNQWYNRWNGNSRTAKFLKFHTSQILLQSLGKIFNFNFFSRIPDSNDSAVKVGQMLKVIYHSYFFMDSFTVQVGLIFLQNWVIQKNSTKVLITVNYRWHSFISIITVFVRLWWMDELRTCIYFFDECKPLFQAIIFLPHVVFYSLTVSIPNLSVISHY